MGLFTNLFKCSSETNKSVVADTFCEKQISFLKSRMTDLEVDVKSMKVAHDLEIKRIEDKLLTQIQLLSGKIDTILLQINKN